MKIEMWPVDKTVPYAKNARKISDQAVGKVAAKHSGLRLPPADSWSTNKVRLPVLK